MKSFKLWGAVSLILVLSGILLSATAFASDGNDIAPPTVQVSDPVVPKLSPVMRDVEYVSPDRTLNREEINPIKNPGLFLPDFGLTGTDTTDVDPLVANSLSPMDAPSPLFTFEGQGDFGVVTPPDTTGDVGPNHYVQMVNNSTAIYDKTGSLITSFANNQLWSGAGGYCETYNNGDPIVLYDDMADRWLLSQFALPTGNESMCIAISQTADPTGAYYLYEFLMPDFPDYPKFGVWPDGYYLGTNTGTPNHYYAHAFDRAAMLVGGAATLQSVGGQANLLMPADVDGLLTPNAGDPGVFYTFFDGDYPNHPAGVDRLALFEFDVNWTNPANSTFSLVQELPIASFNYTTCGFFAGDCIPQPGTTQRLDSVDPWPMARLQYRNFGNFEAMVGNFTVDVDGTDHAGIRWFELRKSGAAWTMQQEGTYAPDSDHRFMGSIAMDGSGNIALGYSISSATTIPSIRYTVHAYGDLDGTMQAEATLMAGGGVQTGPYDRWGDYSAMVVDPVDQCTFWYTNEYHDQDDVSFMWNTRIGTFVVPGCTGSLNDISTLDGSVTDADTTNPIEGAEISATLSVTQTFTTNSDVLGEYEQILPVGTYTVTASGFGYLADTVTDVDIISGTTTTLDIALTPAMYYLVSGTVTDGTTGWPLYASIDIDGYPGDPIWTDPETGYYEISLPEGITYTFGVEAWVPGYLPASRSVGPLTGIAIENFSLDVDPVVCNAPGYDYGTPTMLWSESFDAGIPGTMSVVNNGGTCNWTDTDPGSRGNLTGGTGLFAVADSDECGSGTTMDTELQSPIFDSSGYNALIVEYKNEYNDLGSIAQVDVTTDGFANFTTIDDMSGADYRGPITRSITTGDGAGSATAQVRWHYEAGWDWWWEVDDVVVSGTPCVPSPGGLVVGNVYDDNTLEALNGAMVGNEAGFMAEAVETPFDDAVDDGFYSIFSPSGTQTFTATMSGGYSPDVETVSVIDGDTVLQNFYLEAGWLTVDPANLHVTLDMGSSISRTLDLDNSGGFPADFEIREKNGGFVPTSLLNLEISGPQIEVRERLAGYDENATSTAGILTGGGTPIMGVLAAGDVLNQWTTGHTLSWGDGFDLSAGTVWINDNAAGGGTGLNEEFTVAGSLTGASFTPSFGGTWPGDMAYNPNTGMFWQVNVGGDNCIHEWDPSIPAATGSSICGAIWTATSQRGLAWDPTDDSFFIGGWNEFVIYHVASDGSIIEQWSSGLSISGLAYNWQSGQLFIIENSATDTISQFDIASGTVVNSFIVAGFGSNAGAGLAIDCDGNLWAANQLDNNAYLIDSGVSGALCFGDVPWLSTDPITGTVPTLSGVIIDVTFDASVPEIDQPGDYLAMLNITNDTPYDNLSVPVTMTVESPNTWGRIEGTVTGLGYCDAAPTPLEDAEVLITDSGGMTYTLMTDSNGYYSRWYDESLSTFNIEVTYPEHEDGSAAGVVVSGGVTTTVDFDLRLLEPCVSVDPAGLEIRLIEGYSDTVSLDLINTGALTTGFELVEKEGGYGLVSPLIAIPEFAGKLPKNNVPISMSRSLDAPRLSGDDSSIFFPLAGESAYAMDIYPGENLVNILDTSVPGTWNVVGNVAGSQYFAGDFMNGDFSTLYVIDYGTNSLYEVDTATAIPTLIGSSPPSAGTWSGATSAVDGTFFASSAVCGTASYLHTIDVVTGAVTLVGTITNGPCIIDIAINTNGELYGVDIVNDSLVAIDPATGAGTVIGVLGVDANYAQGMDFEEETGVLYWAAYTTQGELRIIDTTTGASTLVGAFPGGAEVDCLAFATGGGYSDIPWLSTDPITGTLAADSSQIIDVTFDTMTYTVGTYTGTLMVKTDDPMHDKIEVPVTMHVEAIRYGVELAAEEDSLSGEPGSVVTYTVWMTNTGNVPDGYDMAAGSHNWDMDMPASMDPMAPAESHPMEVAITIPADADDGESDSVTITVSSQGDSAETASITLTTEAVIPEYLIYLPLIYK